MDLNERDCGLLNGEEGPALQFAMQVVVRAGEMSDAPHLIDTSFVHIDACHYYGIAHLDFAQFFVDAGVTFDIPAWTNTVPVSLIQDDPRDETDDQFLGNARQLAELYKTLGAKQTWTCAPYQIPGSPKFGDHIVGSESNAVTYFNSAVGARSNKYGDFLDVCAGLVGRVPFSGLHTDEGRRGSFHLDITGLDEVLRHQEVFCHALGHLLGKVAGNDIAVIDGLPKETHVDSLKAISAASAASGGVALFHAVGVTPEAQDFDEATQGQAPQRKLVVTHQMITEAFQSLSTAKPGPLSMVALGTPHFSITEFERLTGLIDGSKIHPDVAFYISTSRFVADLAAKKGWLSILEQAGVEVLVDTCTYFSPAVRAAKGRVMTNSAKWAYYAPGMLSVEVAFGSLEECVLSAVKGETVRADTYWASA